MSEFIVNNDFIKASRSFDDESIIEFLTLTSDVDAVITSLVVGIEELQNKSEWISVDDDTEFYKGGEYHIITDDNDQYYAEFDGSDFECAFMGNVFIPMLAVKLYMPRPAPPKQ